MLEPRGIVCGKVTFHVAVVPVGRADVGVMLSVIALFPSLRMMKSYVWVPVVVIEVEKLLRGAPAAFVIWKLVFCDMLILTTPFQVVTEWTTMTLRSSAIKAPQMTNAVFSFKHFTSVQETFLTCILNTLAA